MYYNKWLHRYTILLVGATFLLIFIGGLVTSTDSGLSVPDWPTTYGHFMFSYPISKMVGGILYEHGHRMVASIVGLLTVILVIWLWLKEPRRWVRWFGVGALLAVIIQGILGGITVLLKLPTAVSVAHGTIAQTFFCMTIGLAVFTSKSWQEVQGPVVDTGKPSLPALSVVLTALVFVQLILGAIMRHMGAGLAIPDFPLSWGRLIPPLVNNQIIINFMHRLGAFLVSVAVFWTYIRISKSFKEQTLLFKSAAILLLALIVQIVLAAITVWSKMAVIPTTAHVANGALILGLSFYLTLQIMKRVESSSSIQEEVVLNQSTV
ncbi:MAG: heme A synthase [Calditrichaeota bacterium]|nr:MAG: heme A synthase [Calditrichota bacterium]